MLLRILTVALLALAMHGCGLHDKDTPPGPPIPDSPKEHQGTGTPLFIFGSGNRLRGFEADDEEYQEYLLWKEWQEYQNYLKWQRSQQEQQQGENAGQSEQAQ